MSYAARLARLERLAGKGVENCPLCRLLVRSTWSDPRKPVPPPAPSLEVYSECEMCGGRLRHDLSKYSERERELARIFLTSKMEDLYTDPRAYAAWRWYWERDKAREARRKQRRERERMERTDGTGDERRPEQENGPGEKLYTRLMSEFLAFRTRRRRLLQAKYGARPFPELDTRLDAVTHADRKHLYEGFSWRVPFSLMFELEREEAAWLKCAEAERFVLGDALAATREKIADCERRALELIEEARRRHEAKEEAERRRREDAERQQREYLERTRAAPPASTAVTPVPAPAPGIALPRPHVAHPSGGYGDYPMRPAAPPRPPRGTLPWWPGKRRR